MNAESRSIQAPPVRGLDHVELFVPDRRAAARWYDEALGLSVVADYERWADDPRGPLMVSSDGGLTMLALFAGEPERGRPAAGFRRVAFRVDAEPFLAIRHHLARLPDVRRAGRGAGTAHAGRS
jgi:catechol 2,3-dioxygenase-like lactoylglutathione lyase family enzyme